MSNKPLDGNEMALQEFIINGFNITKLASTIYGVSRRKKKVLVTLKKYFNPRFETLSKPIDPSS